MNTETYENALPIAQLHESGSAAKKKGSQGEEVSALLRQADPLAHGAQRLAHACRHAIPTRDVDKPALKFAGLFSRKGGYARLGRKRARLRDLRCLGQLIHQPGAQWRSACCRVGPKDVMPDGVVEPHGDLVLHRCPFLTVPGVYVRPRSYA
jgi:hypothetical protein